MEALPSAAQEKAEYAEDAEWINEALQGYNDLPGQAQRLLELIGDLDVSIQDGLSAADKTTAEMKKSLPQLPYDVQLSRDAALELNTKLSQVDSRLSSEAESEKGLADVIASIREIHEVKSELLAKRDLLVVAQSWNSLEMDVNSLMDDGKYESAADRMREAEKSISLYKEGEETYEKRRSLQIELRNNLEARVKPLVLQSIEKNDMELKAKMKNVFSILHRDSIYRDCFFTAKQISVIDLWGSQNSKELSALFSEFYAHWMPVLDNIIAELPSEFPQVPHIENELATAIANVFKSLNPSLNNVLVSHLKTPHDIAQVIAAYDESVKFVAANHARNFLPEQWFVPVLEPYLPFQQEFPHLEERYIQAEWPPALWSESGGVKSTTTLENGLAKIIGLTNTVFHHSAQFTHGRGHAHLLKLLDMFIGDWVAGGSARVKGMEADTHVERVGQREVSYVEGDYDFFSKCLLLLSECHKAHHSFTNIRQTIAGRLAVAARLSSLHTDITLLDQLPMSHEAKQILSIFDTSEASSTRPRSHSTLFAPHGSHTKSLSQTGLEHAVAQLKSLRSWDAIPGLLDAPSSESPTLIDALLPNSHFALVSLVQQLQLSFHRRILAPFKQVLESYDRLPLWSGTKATLPSLAETLSFSVDASDTVRQTGDGLYHLLTIFDNYKDQEALKVSLSTLPYAKAGPDDNDLSLTTSEDAVAAWLASVASAVLALVLEKVERISHLSDHGAAQLACDLQFLENVLQSLYVDVGDTLKEWYSGLSLEEKDLRRILHSEPQPVVIKIANLRKWL